MKNCVFVFLTLLFVNCSDNDEPFQPDEFYFPPLTGTNWETESPASLGWDVPKLEEALVFAESKNTYGLIILHKGKIVTEQYWKGWDKDEVYFIASAGKSVTAFLAGIAQQESDLNITSKTSDHLGTGWTSATLEKENLITVRHQLTMTTGLEWDVADDNCITPSCLQYKSDAGTEWYYYNAPYRLVQNVIATATDTDYNQYTKTKLADKIGMKNYTWYNYVLWLNTRDMARFGLLILNKGTWDGEQILTDQNYFEEMTNSSQSLNPSYGYLWWLNGQSSFKAPSLTTTFPGALCPPAPTDMFSALGKGDKKIYVIPSLDLVVVRHGDDSGENTLGPSSFDDQFWEKLMMAIN